MVQPFAPKLALPLVLECRRAPTECLDKPTSAWSPPLPLRGRRGASLTAPRSPRLRRRRGASLTAPLPLSCSRRQLHVLQVREEARDDPRKRILRDILG